MKDEETEWKYVACPTCNEPKRVELWSETVDYEKEPMNIGTVVSDETGNLYVRTRTPGKACAWQTVMGETGYWDWSELDHPVVVHGGYMPPTPEPTGWAAVVRDNRGVEWIQIEASPARWSNRGLNSLVFWENIEQPVEVLFEGVK